MLPLSVDSATVINDVNYNCLLIFKDFVQDAIIADAELVQTSQVTGKGFWMNVAQASSQPANALCNPTPHWPVESRQIARGSIEDANVVHSDHSRPS